MATGLITAGGALLLASIALAPFQCGKERDPAFDMEETPGEALYRLAERFRAEGDPGARKKTLREIVDRYPSSRFAAIARDELAAAGEPVPDPG